MDITTMQKILFWIGITSAALSITASIISLTIKVKSATSS